MDKYLELVNLVMEKAGALIVQLKLALQKRDFFSIVAAVMIVVKVVEEVASGFKGLTGADKKKAAIEIINRLIDVPIVPESVEEWVISFLVDKVVGWLNDTIWKKKPQTAGRK